MNTQNKTNDIRVVILIPRLLKQYLAACGSEAQCSLRDEIIKRLTATFENKEAHDAIQMIVTDAITTALNKKPSEE